jgi:hypothetical protein
MATSASNEKTAKVITVFFIVVLGAIAWLVAPLFLPVWRWTEFKFEDVAAQHKIPVEQITEAPYKLYFNPRAKGDPLPWQIILGSGKETPPWVVDPEGKPVDEYQTLVRVELINDRTGEKPGEMFLGGTQHDKYFRCRGWRLPAGSLGRTHTRPIILYQGSSFEKYEISESKSFGPILKQDLRRGNYIMDDNLDYGFEWRRDPFGDKLLYGEPEPEPELQPEADTAE